VQSVLLTTAQTEPGDMAAPALVMDGDAVAAVAGVHRVDGLNDVHAHGREPIGAA
jgi:hypothetical protein